MQLPLAPVSLSQVTSTAAADVHTVSAPSDITGVILTVATTSCYITFDGSTPSATNGLLIPTGLAPFYLPITCASIKVASTAAASSVVNVQWVR